MKLANYDFQTSENVLASSRQIGAINRNMALEVEKFFSDNRDAYVSLMESMPVDEGNRARGFDRRKKLNSYMAQSARNANLRRAGIKQAEDLGTARRALQSAQNRALQQRGFGPVPTIAPAKPVKPGFFETVFPVVQGALGIASSISTLSDRNAKENIVEVGISPQGYKIYEFNYKGGEVRYRGAMAQDVLKKNPMAVGIDQNYLTVDYRQIDIDMEVV